MFRELHLTNFKNFRDATLELGPFTVLVGANASGKSNLRDAFRFLHGVGRGYTLTEILEGKTNEGSGEKTWGGIRGGIANVLGKEGGSSFALGADLFTQHFSPRYQLQVELRKQDENGQTLLLPYVQSERFSLSDYPVPIYETEGDPDRNHLPVTVHGRNESTAPWPDHIKLDRETPAVSQLSSSYPSSEIGRANAQRVQHDCENLGALLENMRFIDLDPSVLRSPEHVGQRTLGSRGENLAPVLRRICREPQKKKTLVEWAETLTPMDVKDFDFDVAEHSNEVTLILVEKDGARTPMQSASGGTLRFLGLLALLFNRAATDRLLFIEEIETGLHPTRLDLLANLIEQRTEQTGTQVIATTHSPQFLQVLDDETLEDAQLVYRTGDGPEAKICPLLEVPTAHEVLADPEQSVRELHSTGWFERVLAFSGEEAVGP
jgi:predicted ATPase